MPKPRKRELDRIRFDVRQLTNGFILTQYNANYDTIKEVFCSTPTELLDAIDACLVPINKKGWF